MASDVPAAAAAITVAAARQATRPPRTMEADRPLRLLAFDQVAGQPVRTGQRAAPAIDTTPVLPAASKAVPSIPPRVAEEGIPAAAAMATATSLPTGKPGTARESGRLKGEAGPAAADTDGPAGVAEVRTADQRPPSIPSSGGTAHPVWRPRRLHFVLVGAVLVVAAIVAFALAGSPSSPPALSYSQFLHDVAAREMKIVDLAYEVGETSSGTLANGTSYTVVIPLEAGQQLQDNLVANGVQVTRPK
jgi:hypothetical protein